MLIDLLLRFIWGWFATLLFHARLETSERYLKIAFRYVAVAGLLGVALVYAGIGLDVRPPEAIYLSFGLAVGGSALYTFFTSRWARVGGVAAVLLAPLSAGPIWSMAKTINFIGGALLLASPLASQFLGHWYLNVVGMNLGELTRSMKVMFAALLIKSVEVLCALSVHFFLNPDSSVHPWIGLVLATRMVWGIAAPWFMAWMAFQSVKIRSTQSATGILYAASVAVIVGEITSLYLQRLLGWGI